MPEGLSMPLVSIIIPHYNGENIIRECLKSLQNISYKNVEIIVAKKAMKTEFLTAPCQFKLVKKSLYHCSE